MAAERRPAPIRAIILAALGTTVVGLYAVLFAIYGLTHRVPRGQLGENFLRLHTGAIAYGDQHLLRNRAAYLLLYPAQALLFRCAGIDAEVHQGDMLWHEFAADDYLD
jgi:hypothetical protein